MVLKMFKSTDTLRDAQATLIGTTAKETDDQGHASFADVKLVGNSARYRLTFKSGTDTAQSKPIRYAPIADFDRNMFSASAIRTISGLAPKGEFFDLRFRFRLTENIHSLAAIDLSISNRASADSVASEQKRLVDALLMTNVSLGWAGNRVTDIPDRQVFIGAQARVLNTIPFYGAHLGSIELGHSPFAGSSMSIGYLRSWYGEETVKIDSAELKVPKQGIGIEFFVRSDKYEFFKVLTVRGSTLIPVGRTSGEAMTRIVVAVPLGALFSF
ncbi:MAG: hypothetical protein C0516_10580 [Gemmatimonas sp.]|nr:hypothetical protein [Gemmatimonas sp.]